MVEEERGQHEPGAEPEGGADAEVEGARLAEGLGEVEEEEPHEEVGQVAGEEVLRPEPLERRGEQRGGPRWGAGVGDAGGALRVEGLRGEGLVDEELEVPEGLRAEAAALAGEVALAVVGAVVDVRVAVLAPDGGLLRTGPHGAVPVRGEGRARDDAVGGVNEGAGGVGPVEEVVARVDEEVEEGHGVQRAREALREGVRERHHPEGPLVEDERAHVLARDGGHLHVQVHPHQVQGDGHARHFLGEPRTRLGRCLRGGPSQLPPQGPRHVQQRARVQPRRRRVRVRPCGGAAPLLAPLRQRLPRLERPPPVPDHLLHLGPHPEAPRPLRHGRGPLRPGARRLRGHLALQVVHHLPQLGRARAGPHVHDPLLLRLLLLLRRRGVVPLPVGGELGVVARLLLRLATAIERGHAKRGRDHVRQEEAQQGRGQRQGQEPEDGAASVAAPGGHHGSSAGGSGG